MADARASWGAACCAPTQTGCRAVGASRSVGGGNSLDTLSGAPPGVFSKSGEVVQNEWLAELPETGMRRPLKIL